MSADPAKPLLMRAIAAGFDDGRNALRVTVLATAEVTATADQLRHWPTLAAQQRRGLGLLMARPTPAGRTLSAAFGRLPVAPKTLEIPPQPTPAAAKRIQQLWEQLLAPPRVGPDGWTLLEQYLKGQCTPPPKNPDVIGTPAGHASLGLTLERARTLLEAIAEPGSQLLAGRERRLARTEPAWPPPIRLASHDTVASDASQPESAWPEARHVVEAVLDHDERFEQLLARVDHVHRIATAPADISQANPDDPVMMAGWRLAAILSDPVLQRLFGLAADVYLDLDALVPADGGEVFRALAVAGQAAPEAWTLARVRSAPHGHPRHFGPATWEEVEGGADPEVLESLVRLGTGGAPARYDLCTLDPELGVEARNVTQGMRTKGRARPDQVHTLRSGGLRLLDLQAAASAAARREKQHALACTPIATQVIEDASDLAIAERVDIGLDTAGGTVWRAVSHRVIRYADIYGSPGWIEEALLPLVGPPSGPRRLELSAAPVVRSILEKAPELPNPPNDGPKERADYNQKLIAEATVCAWSGDPMGVGLKGPPNTKSSIPAWVGEHSELALDQHVSLPGAGFPNEALAMPLRFGWLYRVGVRRTYLGGGGLTLAEASEGYARLDACLPGKGAQGRRLLRHERVGPPAVGLTRAEWNAATPSDMPRQAAGAAVVRSGLPGYETASTVRILMPPGVPLDFAACHPGFATVLAMAQGSRLGGFTPLADAKVAVLNVAHPPPEAFHPDPAASLMVLRLRRIDDPVGWVGEPAVLRIADGVTWPDIRPVHLQVVRGAKGSVAVLAARPGAFWLGRGEQLIAGRAAAALGGAAPVASAVLSLPPGADYELVSWCVPTVDQLATLFDACEAAGMLAIAAGSRTGAAPGLRCVTGLKGLLDPGTEDPPALGGQAAPAAHPAAPCAGAGHLEAPTAAELGLIAARLHGELLRTPLLSLVNIATIVVTHATPAPVSAPALADDDGLRVVRRLFPGGDGPILAAPAKPGDAKPDEAKPAEVKPKGETRLDFVTAVQRADWTVGMTQPGAGGALFAGRITVDLATTVGLELRIHAAGGSGQPLDDIRRSRAPDDRKARRWPHGAVESRFASVFGFTVGPGGQVQLPESAQTLLRIDGLPRPPDGDSREELTLEGLQAAAWDRAKPYGGGLTVKLSGFIDDPLARRLRVRLAGIGRHGQLVTMEKGVSTEAIGKEEAVIWLPATERPSPPLVRDVIHVPAPGEPYAYSGEGGRWTVGVQRKTRIRIRLARPWYSSGEGEMLGLVLWPPALQTDGVPPGLPDELLDADLGPGGASVTRWGADSIYEAPTPDKLVPWGAIQPHGEVVPVSRAFMPLPSDASTVSGLQSGAAYLTVALKAVHPLFDPEEEDWFVDLDVAELTLAMPWIRLGLVRYQPHAREDIAAPLGGEAVRLRLSTPVTRWMNPLPHRKCEATWRAIDGRHEVYVTVSGFAASTGTGGAKPAAHMRIELLHKADGLVATDEAGVPCQWESWTASPFGRVEESEGFWTFTCLFVARLDGPAAVSVEEMERMLLATPDPANPGKQEESGPRLLVTLDLVPGA